MKRKILRANNKFIATAMTAVLALNSDSSIASTIESWNIKIVPDSKIGSFRHGTFPSLGNNTHAGYDLIAPCGSSVRAYRRGRVIDVIDKKNSVNYDSLGFMVILLHEEDGRSGNIYSTYFHLKSGPKRSNGDRLVVGSEVALGEEIGQVGMTGNATGCHLHFELRRFANRFHPAWNNIYGPGDKRFDAVFRRDWVELTGPATSPPVLPQYDSIYVDGRGVVPGVVRLPAKSMRLIDDAKCSKVAVKSMAALVPRSVNCIGQVEISGTTFLIYPNWLRSKSSPGLVRVAVSGDRPQVLGDLALVPEGYIAPILVEGQFVEFLSVAPQSRYVEKTGHPYLRYRVVGTSGTRQIQLIPTKMFTASTNPIEINRRSIAAASPAVAASSVSAVGSSPEQARASTGSRMPSPADVFRNGNPELDRNSSSTGCGSVGRDGVIINLGDFFQCDEAAAVRSMQVGRRILFDPQTVTFSQGKFVARMTQQPAKVQDAKRRLEDRENGRRRNQGYMEDFGMLVRSESFSVTCNFRSRQVNRGKSIITFAKLVSWSGRSAVFDCD